MDVGVELDVDRVRQLDPERVGQPAPGQQPAARHRDEDLRLEAGVLDLLRELTAGLAEAVPREDLLLGQVVGIRVVGRHGGHLRPAARRRAVPSRNGAVRTSWPSRG